MDDHPRRLPEPADTPAAPLPPTASDHEAAHRAKGERRSPDTIWRRNPREQGLIGVTDAIAYFGGIGWAVSVPLIDSQPYDLVVDDGQHLHRVQVKTTTRRGRAGHYLVQLCTRGGNQSFHTTKYFDPARCDLVYVLTDARERYLLPAALIRVRSSLTLNKQWEGYRQ